MRINKTRKMVGYRRNLHSSIGLQVHNTIGQPFRRRLEMAFAVVCDSAEPADVADFNETSSYTQHQEPNERATR